MILYHYLLKEVSKSFLSIFVILFSIILSTQIIKTLSAVNNGQISLEFLFSLIVLSNVKSLILIVPLVMYLAIILTLSRLYSRSEIVAMSSCGFGPNIFFKSLLPFTVILLILELVLVVWISPQVNSYIDQIKHAVSNTMAIDLIEPGKFNISSNNQQLIYVDDIDERQQLSKIFIRLKAKNSTEPNKVNEEYIISANKGQVKDVYEDGSRYLILYDGYRYDLTQKNKDLKLMSFSEYGILIKPKAWKHMKKDEDTESFQSLWEIRDRPAIQAELQWRISMIISIVVLFFLAIPLSKIEPRKGPYSKILPAIILYFVYYSLLKSSGDWVKQEHIPYWLGLWWVHISFVLFSLVLLSRQLGWFKLFKKANQKAN